MIDVEERSLRALEEDPLTSLGGGEQHLGRVADVRTQALGESEVLIGNRLGVEPWISAT